MGDAFYVDVAGDAKIRGAVHGHWGDQLKHSAAVGITHKGDLGGSGELAGPAPTFFFAPTRLKKRSEDWGRAGLEQRVAEAWHPFCEWTAGWLETIPGAGFEALQSAYLEVLEGGVDPRTAHVISLAG